MKGKITVNLKRGMNPAGYSASGFKVGQEVFLYQGHTYGVITHEGVAITRVENEFPFIEVPASAVEWTN